MATITVPADVSTLPLAIAAALKVSTQTTILLDGYSGIGYQGAAPPGLKIIGDGISVINKAGGAKGGLDFESSNGTVLQNLIVDGATDETMQAEYGIRVVKDTALVVNNCTVRNCGTGGTDTHCSHSQLTNNTFESSKVQHGWYSANSESNVLFQGNKCLNNAGCGYHTNGDLSQGKPGINTGFKIIGNTFAGNTKGTNLGGGGKAINVDGGQNFLIENNLCYGNPGGDLALFKGDSAAAAIDAVVVNNTFNNVVEIENGSVGATVFNNIALGGISVDAASKSGYEASNNIVTGGAALFNNAAGGDYSLASSSPAIGAGVASFNGKTAPSTDINGVTVTKISCGAYTATPPAVQPSTSILTSVTLTATSTSGLYAVSGFDQTGAPFDPVGSLVAVYNGVSSNSLPVS